MRTKRKVKCLSFARSLFCASTPSPREAAEPSTAVNSGPPAPPSPPGTFSVATSPSQPASSAMRARPHVIVQFKGCLVTHMTHVWTVISPMLMKDAPPIFESPRSIRCFLCRSRRFSRRLHTSWTSWLRGSFPIRDYRELPLNFMQTIHHHPSPLLPATASPLPLPCLQRMNCWEVRVVYHLTSLR